MCLYSSREVKQLDKFREQQKAIEEANKLKKDLLSKTLSERYSVIFNMMTLLMLLLKSKETNCY
jgi:hypothetical protein